MIHPPPQVPLKFHAADLDDVAAHKLAIRAQIVELDAAIKKLNEAVDQAMKHRAHLLAQLAGANARLERGGYEKSAIAGRVGGAL